jgi:uncharacterized cupredoxin-like copper-binding protein
MRGGRAIAALLVPAALAAAGCGSDIAYTRSADHRVMVHLSEYRITPQNVEVPAGRITLVARNTGRLTHNLAVVQFDRPKSGEQELMYGKPTKTLFPGQTGSTTVDLKAGKYRMVCTLANHDNLGQYGELKVVP